MSYKCSICSHRSQSIGAAGKHMRKAHPQIYQRRQAEGRAKAKQKKVASPGYSSQKGSEMPHIDPGVLISMMQNMMDHHMKEMHSKG